MAGRRARARLLLAYLGQQVSPATAASIQQSLSDQTPSLESVIGQSEKYWNPFTAAFWAPTDQIPPAGVAALPTSGQNWSWADILNAAATGNVPQDVVNQLQNQETQNLVTAGMDPASAAVQASQDVTAALTQFTAPGAFGINWQGATPGGTNWVTQAGANVANAFGASSGSWVWWALGGVGALWLLTRR